MPLLLGDLGAVAGLRNARTCVEVSLRTGTIPGYLHSHGSTEGLPSQHYSVNQGYFVVHRNIQIVSDFSLLNPFQALNGSAYLLQEI